ncbi:MAG TPA: hypothetical protein VGR55_00480 [Candidatus Acidoferrum sp.]|nr:hypothetical protein [Candidatus Acidoferrum sp.]
MKLTSNADEISHAVRAEPPKVSFAGQRERRFYLFGGKVYLGYVAMKQKMEIARAAKAS